MAKQYGIPISALQTALGKGRIVPVYLLVGEEQFLADQAVQLIASATAKAHGEPRRITYTADETDITTILDDLRSLDLFSPARIVVVHRADKLINDKSAQLVAYLDRPADKSVLILIADKVDARRKIVTLALAADGWINCRPLYPEKVLPWIIDYAKSQKIELDRNAAALLADYLGADLATIASELEKLVTYAGSRKIGAAHVEAVSLRDHARTVFELTDAIAAKQAERILVILNRLLDQDEPPLRILFTVAKHFRRLMGTAEMIAAGEDPRTAAAKAGNQFFINEFLEQVRAFSPRQYRRFCSLLLQAELTLKSRPMDDRLVLETTFLRLIGTRPAGAPPSRR